MQKVHNLHFVNNNKPKNGEKNQSILKSRYVAKKRNQCIKIYRVSKKVVSIILNINKLYWLRFGCVLVAFPWFLAQRLRNFGGMCQNSATKKGGCAPNATEKTGIKKCNIMIINVLKSLTNDGCVVAPKKYPIPFEIERENFNQ